MYGGNAPRPERHVLPDGLQRAARAAGRAGGRRRRRHRARHPPLATAEGAGPRPSCSHPACRVPWALEAQQLLAEDWGVSADVWSVTSWTELRRDGLAADEHNFLHPDEERARAVPDEQAAGRRGPVRRGERLHARRPRPDPPVRARASSRRSAPTASASRTPAPRPVGSSRSTARRSSCARSQALAARGEVDPALAGQAIEKYRLHDVTAGTTGNAGGES